VIGYQTMEEALAFIRNRSKPLALYLFTTDRSLESRILRDTSSGSVVVNDVVVNQIVPGLPFGGVGESGIGSFHGRYTFDAFSRSKAVMRRSLWPDPDLRYPPFTKKKDHMAQKLL